MNLISRRLGFLWVKEQPDGSFYATGFLEGLAGDISFKVVANLNKLKESHAPYVLIRKELKDNQDDEEPKQYLGDV